MSLSLFRVWSFGVPCWRTWYRQGHLLWIRSLVLRSSVIPRTIFLARSSLRAGSFRQEKTKPRLGETSRNSRDSDSNVYEIPRFLSGTKMCKVSDFRLGRDLVSVWSVEDVTSLKTQKYLSSRVRSCWNRVSRDTDRSDQSKCKRILEIRGQLWVSLPSSSWKLVTCQTKEKKKVCSISLDCWRTQQPLFARCHFLLLLSYYYLLFDAIIFLASPDSFDRRYT